MNDEGYMRVGGYGDTFDICVEGDKGRRHLDLYFDGGDKSALFFGVLGVFDPVAAVDGKVAIDDWNKGKWDELCSRYDEEIERATAKLPMIRRLEKEYEDAVFASDEVDALKKECLVVQSGTSHVGALAALDTLIRACDEAEKEQGGLLFGSD